MDELSTHRVYTDIMADRETHRKIREWLESVRARGITQKRRQIMNIRRDLVDVIAHCDQPLSEYESHVTTEEVLVVEIPLKELTTMAEVQDWYKRHLQGYPIEKFDEMIRNKESEEYLRKKHVGLQEAWEQYQIMLALCENQTYR